MTRSTNPKRAAAIAVALVGVLGVLGPAYAAGLTAQATAGPQNVSSATFAVVPTKLASTPPPGPLVLTYAAVLAPGPQYFDVVNTGSIDLVGAGYAAALTSLVDLGATTLRLSACPGLGWNQVTGACAVTPVDLGGWTAADGAPKSSSAAPYAPGSRLSIKATLSAGTLAAATVATISTSVSSGPLRQIRPARTTSS